MNYWPLPQKSFQKQTSRKSEVSRQLEKMRTSANLCS